MIAEKAIGRDSEYAIHYAKHEKLEQLLGEIEARIAASGDMAKPS